MVRLIWVTVSFFTESLEDLEKKTKWKNDWGAVLDVREWIPKWLCPNNLQALPKTNVRVHPLNPPPLPRVEPRCDRGQPGWGSGRKRLGSEPIGHRARREAGVCDLLRPGPWPLWIADLMKPLSLLLSLSLSLWCWYHLLSWQPLPRLLGGPCGLCQHVFHWALSL